MAEPDGIVAKPIVSPFRDILERHGRLVPAKYAETSQSSSASAPRRRRL